VSVSSRPNAYFQSIRLRTASAAWRSDSPSANCSTDTSASRAGESAGRPRTAPTPRGLGVCTCTPSSPQQTISPHHSRIRQQSRNRVNSKSGTRHTPTSPLGRASFRSPEGSVRVGRATPARWIQARGLLLHASGSPLGGPCHSCTRVITGTGERYTRRPRPRLGHNRPR
jgi:hypothetical protein